ncbi:MAG: hypothetical protein P8Z81_11240 [Deinococcales bacterium]
MIRTVPVLAFAFVIMWAAGQSVLHNAASATDGAVLHVDATPIVFTLGSTDVPSPDAGPTVVYPSAGASFNVITAVPTQGLWLIDVDLSTPPRRAQGLATLSGDHVQVSLEALDGSTADGCNDVPWTPIGSGMRVAALTSQGTCRYEARLRLLFSGRLPPGSYEGVLAWSITKAQSP